MPDREMNLLEYVRRLTKGHRARKDLADLYQLLNSVWDMINMDWGMTTCQARGFDNCPCCKRSGSYFIAILDKLKEGGYPFMEYEVGNIIEYWVGSSPSERKRLKQKAKALIVKKVSRPDRVCYLVETGSMKAIKQAGHRIGEKTSVQLIEASAVIRRIP